jgi:ArsR family transcriptional regulator, arsenate/arsenite/antimonite-responsive transcriptional repressor
MDIDMCQYVSMRTTTRTEAACCSVVSARVGPEDAKRLAEGFKALSDPVRLTIYSLIASQPTGEMCACDLVTPTGKSQPTVSHHLKALYEAGLVEREKRGSWVWYRAVPGRLEELRSALEPAFATT